jgi:hypothetical protein
LKGAVVVAVSAVRVVQVSTDEVVRVVAVGDSLVATAGTVNVVLSVATAPMRRRTRGWVRCVDRHFALVHVPVVGAMKVTIVQVVDVVAVTNRCVPAARTVDVIVIGVGLVAHVFLFLPGDVELFFGDAARAPGTSSACSSPARISSRT